jgi:hypothetical protein
MHKTHLPREKNQIVKMCFGLWIKFGINHLVTKVYVGVWVHFLGPRLQWIARSRKRQAERT